MLIYQRVNLPFCLVSMTSGSLEGPAPASSAADQRLLQRRAELLPLQAVPNGPAVAERNGDAQPLGEPFKMTLVNFWLVVWNMVFMIFYDFPYIYICIYIYGKVIIPTDFHIFQDG